MSSEITPDNPLHPKRAGSSVESAVVNVEPDLEFVGDSEAEWHDARTTAVLTPTRERPFGGVCVVERDTPVEIKGTLPEHENGDGTAPGRWYIKRPTHERLEAENGVYYFVVYEPKPSTPLLARLVVPAATVGDILEGSWYENRGRDVARLSWTRLIDRDAIGGGR
jgi:hypothetical protein